MRVGLSTGAYYGRLETEDAAARVASLAVPCAEVFFQAPSEYSEAFGARVKARLGATEGVSCHCKTQHFETDFIGQSPRQRADALRAFGGFLAAGRAAGAGVYVYHGPSRVRGGKPLFARWQEGVGAAVDLCGAYGLRFCWETVSYCWLNEPARVREFSALWPELGFVLDIKQVLEMGQDPAAYIDAMGERLRHVHILDYGADGAHALPGKGVRDFRELRRALAAAGYDGDIILEPYYSVFRGDDAALRASLRFLEDTFL